MGEALEPALSCQSWEVAQSVHSARNATQNTRSSGPSRARRPLRCTSVASCWRRARLSSSNAWRERARARTVQMRSLRSSSIAGRCWLPPVIASDAFQRTDSQLVSAIEWCGWNFGEGQPFGGKRQGYTSRKLRYRTLGSTIRSGVSLYVHGHPEFFQPFFSRCPRNTLLASSTASPSMPSMML